MALNEYEKDTVAAECAAQGASPRSAPTRLSWSIWDEQLACNGAVIIAGRQQFLRELEVKARETHRALSRWRGKR